MMGEIVTRNT